MKRIPFGRLTLCLVLACAVVRFAGVVASGVTAVTYGDFAETLPGPYAEALNPTLWNSPDLATVQARQTYTYGPTQFLTLYPMVFLDSYAAIARLLLVVYVGLILLTCWVISKSFDFISEGDAVSRRLLIYGSTFLFFPLLQALTQREFEVVILLALSLMYWSALRDNRPALGSLIAYITWFKYLPLVVGLPYLIARRWWGAAAAFALTSVVILGLGELLFGMSLFFPDLNQQNTLSTQFTALSSSTAFCADWSPTQTTHVNIRWGLCGLKAQGFWVPLPFSYLALIAVTAFVGYVGLWSFEHRDEISLASERWRRVWEISLVIIVYSTFFHGHYYYLSVLILPLLALFIRFTSGAAIQKARLAIAVLAYVLLSAFVLPVSALSAVFGVDFWQFYLSYQFYLVGELLLLALVLREYVAPSFKVTRLKAALLPTRRHACGAAFTIVLAVSSLYWSAVLTAPLLESQPAAVIAEQDVADLRVSAEQGSVVAQLDPKAVSGIQQLAEQGDAEAQLVLGGMYFSGQGVAEDAAEGVRWWRLAAEQGHLPAQTGLGGRYFNGRGVAQDEVEAMRWYRLAAEQGDAEVLAWMHLTAEQGQPDVQVALAGMYSFGLVVPLDADEALRWYRLAAEQGHADAQVALGHRYDTGEGVVQDEAEAARWYRRAAAQGHAESLGRVHLTAEQGSVEAQASLGEMYAAGEGVPPDAVEAIRWWRLAAEQGHAEAQVALGHRYDSGEGVAQDEAEAAKWYRRAAEQGHAEAQVTLGVMYETGRGVARDAGEAVGWYQRAAEQGDVSAQVNLEEFYAARERVARDEAAAGVWYRRTAAWWFRLAADRGWAAAQATLGEMYAAGEGVPQDELQAMRWYRRAAEQGSVAAQARLADMFAEGRGVPRDQVQAHTWFNLAAARASGEERARYENARDLIAEQMTSAQIAAAQRRAREWDAAHPRGP